MRLWPKNHACSIKVISIYRRPALRTWLTTAQLLDLQVWLMTDWMSGPFRMHCSSHSCPRWLLRHVLIFTLGSNYVLFVSIDYDVTRQYAGKSKQHSAEKRRPIKTVALFAGLRNSATALRRLVRNSRRRAVVDNALWRQIARFFRWRHCSWRRRSDSTRSDNRRRSDRRYRAVTCFVRQINWLIKCHVAVICQENNEIDINS